MSLPIDTRTTSLSAAAIHLVLREIQSRVGYLLASNAAIVGECVSGSIRNSLEEALETLRTMAGSVSLAEMLATSAYARPGLPAAHMAGTRPATIGVEYGNAGPARRLPPAVIREGDQPILVASA